MLGETLNILNGYRSKPVIWGILAFSYLCHTSLLENRWISIFVFLTNELLAA